MRDEDGKGLRRLASWNIKKGKGLIVSKILNISFPMHLTKS
jgi:hypothetical protein